MLFYFCKGKNATQNRKKICAMYEEDAVSERVCQNWFAKFRAGDMTCEDREHSGRPLVVDDDQIKNLIESNPHYTTREIAEIIDISQKTVVNYLHTLDYVSRYGIWVPHNLSDKNLMDRISICDLLLKRNENCPFLKWMITGDKKWIVYNNVQRKKPWRKKDKPPQTTATSKQNIVKKVILCIWWDCKGIVYYDYV